MKERVMRATALSYLISPEALGAVEPDPVRLRDRFSWAYLVAAAGRIVRDLGTLRARVDRAGQRLATFTLETEVRFASAADRDAFTRELADHVALLAVKYHDEHAKTGRLFRFVLGAYPAITKTDLEAATGTLSTQLELPASAWWPQASGTELIGTMSTTEPIMAVTFSTRR
jgi:hypothetical protein